MSVDQIRAALDTIDATPRDGFLGELEGQLVAVWAAAADQDVGDGPVSVGDGAALSRRGRPRWLPVAAATIVVLALLAVVAVRDPDGVQTDAVPATPAPTTDPSTASPLPTADSSPATTTSADVPSNAFSGNWTSIDTDGSAQTMEIAAVGDGSTQMTVFDDAASGVCAGAAATVTGTGALNSGNQLVVSVSEVTCDDGSEPAVLGQALGAYTFAYDSESDTLTDNFGVVWWREGAEQPSVAPLASGGMWPQSSIDAVREAQALADAGDPDAKWQVEPELSSDEWWAHLRNRGGAEIVERFLRDELGWGGFVFNTLQGDDGDGGLDGTIRGIVYLRCAPGETNSLYPDASEGQSEAPPGAELCAPTIDDLRYETVSIDLSQLDRRGADGIWVVTRWAMTAPFTLTDPLVAEATATARLDDFLAARVVGEGAEGYVRVGGGPFLALDEVPLLYATTSGAHYERYEIERVSGPWWPYGEMEFEVRMFADGGDTVVSQPIGWTDVGGARLALVHDAKATTENGQPVAVPYAFFEGEVTAFVTPPWEVSVFFPVALTLGDRDSERIELVGDPLPFATGCEHGPIPADADALARSIQSNLDLQATAPVAAIVGGVDGLQMDVVVAPGANVCDGGGVLQLRWSPFDQRSRMRLYLVDLPEDSATRILAIMVVAPDARFAEVLASAAPIIASIELHRNQS